MAWTDSVPCCRSLSFWTSFPPSKLNCQISSPCLEDGINQYSKHLLIFMPRFTNLSETARIVLKTPPPPDLLLKKKSFLLASPFTGQSRFCLCLCNSAQTEQHKQLFSVLLIMRVAFCGYHLDMKHLSPRFETFDMIKLVQGKRDRYWNRVSDRLYWYSIRNPLINFFL